MLSGFCLLSACLLAGLGDAQRPKAQNIPKSSVSRATLPSDSGRFSYSAYDVSFCMSLMYDYEDEHD